MHFLSVLCTSLTVTSFAAVDTGPILDQFGNLIYLAMAVAAGELFLGLETKRSKVLLVVLEMTAAMVRSRMEEIGKDVGLKVPVVDENFSIVAPTLSYVPESNLTDPRGVAALGSRGCSL